MSPEDKAEYIDHNINSIMIGDGINDAAAIAKAKIGISVTGSVTKAFQHADAILLSENILNIKKLWTASKINEESHKALFAFSIIYNSLTAALAILGFIKPLFAAILNAP